MKRLLKSKWNGSFNRLLSSGLLHVCAVQTLVQEKLHPSAVFELLLAQLHPTQGPAQSRNHSVLGFNLVCVLTTVSLANSHLRAHILQQKCDQGAVRAGPAANGRGTSSREFSLLSRFPRCCRENELTSHIDSLKPRQRPERLCLQQCIRTHQERVAEREELLRSHHPTITHAPICRLSSSHTLAQLAAR